MEVGEAMLPGLARSCTAMMRLSGNNTSDLLHQYEIAGRYARATLGIVRAREVARERAMEHLRFSQFS